VNLEAPVAANSCGTFLALRYFARRRSRRANDLEGEQHFVALDEFAHLFDGLGGHSVVILIS
jgi:hypothetical protein